MKRGTSIIQVPWQQQDLEAQRPAILGLDCQNREAKSFQIPKASGLEAPSPSQGAYPGLR